MDRSGITVHGKSVHLYARPTDTTMFELPCRDQRTARIAANRIAQARMSKRFDANTPLYAAMLAWAWWGTGHLSASDSWPKYRGTMGKILLLTGGIELGAADHDWYSRLHQKCINDGWTLSTLESLATVFGAFATWCTKSRDTWDGPRPGGTGLQQIHRAFRAEARSAGKDTHLIRTRDCPGLADAIAFGETLGQLAEDRWGPEYACWRHAPRLHFATGCRLMELPVLGAQAFDLTHPAQASVHIAYQYRDGTHRPGSPHRGPTKDKGIRDARIWASEVEFMAERCEDASRRPGGLLLPLPPRLKTGTRQLQDLLKTAIDEHGYRWTSHAHRSAYISWNLATRAEGGYGCSLARVAQWVGHSDTQLLTRRYWVPAGAEPDTFHSPGERQL